MITVQDIYTKLKLKDADDYMIERHHSNHGIPPGYMDTKTLDPENPHGALYRQIGATTWMAAHVAVAVSQNILTTIVASNFAHSKNIADKVFHMLGIKPGDLPPGTLVWTDTNGFTLARKPKWTTVFHDDQWKERAVRRLHGPFAMTREVRYEYGKYVAYAEDDERLMVFAPEGVVDFMRKRPNVIAVGWTFDLTAKNPLKWDTHMSKIQEAQNASWFRRRRT